MNRLQRLHDAGVSVWLDTLSRELLESGEFGELVRDYAVTGATSNPTIFAKAITGSDRYDEQLRAASPPASPTRTSSSSTLALEDVRRAAELLRPIYDATAAATASSRSSARPTSPTTPRRRSPRRSSSGGGSTSRT